MSDIIKRLLLISICLFGCFLLTACKVNELNKNDFQEVKFTEKQKKVLAIFPDISKKSKQLQENLSKRLLGKILRAILQSGFCRTGKILPFCKFAQNHLQIKGNIVRL